ncbi:MAG: hypothetical protein LQ351_001940 [Letrouitia transgressa]|nr:MAG: hypothetical protein LQ351_001940 [Letrouitia transgressa]
MSFRLLPADITDVPAMMRISKAAFSDDPVVGRIWRDCDKEVQFEHDVRVYGKHMRNRALTGEVFTKVVEEETGKLVAWARWRYPCTLTPEQEREKEAIEQEKPQYPEGTNVELIEEFLGRLNELRSKYVDEKAYLVMPEYQRKGLGSLLIRDGLAAADRDNAITYIEASPAGVELYKRHGWKQVDDILIDMAPYGGEGIASEKCFIRSPGATDTS